MCSKAAQTSTTSRKLSETKADSSLSVLKCYSLYSYGLVLNSLWASSLSTCRRSVRDFCPHLMTWRNDALILNKINIFTQSVLHNEGTVTTESTIDNTGFRLFTRNWRRPKISAYQGQKELQSRCKEAVGSLSTSETQSLSLWSQKAVNRCRMTISSQ